MPTSLRPVPIGQGWPLYDIQGTRLIEQLALRQAPPHALMQRAGLAAARLALALAPHSSRIWVAAGPGNNGGDGLEAATHLQRWGKRVVVSWLGTAAGASADTAASWQDAVDAGVEFSDSPPPDVDLCLDALLGIGATRAPEGRMAQWVARMNASGAPILAIDVPTGLDANTGHCAGVHVVARATLCLLTLKPGLFTAMGRDAAGQVWLVDLQVDVPKVAGATHADPIANLAPRPAVRLRAHASHKGSYGDVAVVGGAPGMSGAAVLAARSALAFGAGRVYVAVLDPAMVAAAALQPELMLRQVEQLPLATLAVACGCGGGDAIRAHLPSILARGCTLVLDADALNAIASDTQLQAQLRARSGRGWRTVLTPHPLEAARLLATSSQQVQQDRLASARELTLAFGCTVVLKGSGTIIAAPARASVINPTGNGRLATAGTGDVLAGAIGAALAAGLPEFEAACEAVYLHGLYADQWPPDEPLTASALAGRLQPLPGY